MNFMLKEQQKISSLFKKKCIQLQIFQVYANLPRQITMKLLHDNFISSILIKKINLYIFIV